MIRNVLLFLTAIILFAVLGPIGFLYGIVTRFKFWLSQFFYTLAVSIDQLWNTFARYLLDDVMITKDWYKFGNEDDTVSYVLWINWKYWTLTRHGKFLCRLLSVIDPGHCMKSI